MGTTLQANQRCSYMSLCQSLVSQCILKRGNPFTLALGTGKMLSVKDYSAMRASNTKVQTPIPSLISQLKHQMETIQKVILSCFPAEVRFIHPASLWAGFRLCHLGKNVQKSIRWLVFPSAPRLCQSESSSPFSRLSSVLPGSVGA